MSARRAILWVLFVLAVPAGSWVIAQGVEALRTPDGTVPRGVLAAEVRELKGDPEETIGPVGDPPIHKWVYADGEIVVLEDRRVVDSFFRE